MPGIRSEDNRVGGPIHVTTLLEEAPSQFIEKVHRVFGEAGRAWLPRLPGIVARCREKWHLNAGTPCPTMSMNYIEFTTTTQGEPVALKVGVPHTELFTEMESLKIYDGRSAVRLIDGDRELGAILMARVQPGTMLHAPGSPCPDKRDQTRAAASVMRALPVPTPAEHTLPTFARWVDRAFRLTRTVWDPEERMPRGLLDRAESAFREILSDEDASEYVVLHGDLHHENILWDADAGWLAIDPKGVIGPRCLELGRFVQNQLPEDASDVDWQALIRETIEILSVELCMTQEKVAAAALVDCVLSASWCFEDAALDPNWDQGVDLGWFLADLAA
jgi:streptomycin 6-kinase